MATIALPIVSCFSTGCLAMMLKHVLPGCLTPQRHAAVPRTAQTPCQPGSRSGGQVYTGVWSQTYTGVWVQTYTGVWGQTYTGVWGQTYTGVWGQTYTGVHWCGVRCTLGYTGVGSDVHWGVGQTYTGVWGQAYTGVHWGVGSDVHWGVGSDVHWGVGHATPGHVTTSCQRLKNDSPVAHLQTPAVIESVLGPVGPVSAYLDQRRNQVLSRRTTKLSHKTRLSDIFASCWDAKLPPSPTSPKKKAKNNSNKTNKQQQQQQQQQQRRRYCGFPIS